VTMRDGNTDFFNVIPQLSILRVLEVTMRDGNLLSPPLFHTSP